jgi:hypothetical protein
LSKDLISASLGDEQEIHRKRERPLLGIAKGPTMTPLPFNSLVSFFVTIQHKAQHPFPSGAIPLS